MIARGEQSALVAVVAEPDAENGAKALLLRELKIKVSIERPEYCELEDLSEGCEICDGVVEYGPIGSQPPGIRSSPFTARL